MTGKRLRDTRQTDSAASVGGGGAGLPGAGKAVRGPPPDPQEGLPHLDFSPHHFMDFTFPLVCI